MEKMTEDFIYALKRDKDSPNLKEAAIKFMMDYTDSPRESYRIGNLYNITKQFFLDYIKTGDAWELMYHFFDHKKIVRNCRDFISETYYPNDDLIAMLTALSMVRVKKDGEYINGFTGK